MSFIRPVSDLHLGQAPYEVVKPLSTDKDSFLVLAGDISVGTRHEDFFDDMVSRFKKVIYVLGNHEFYHHYLDAVPGAIKAFHPDIAVLDDGVYIQDGHRFIGSTLWTNYRDHEFYTMSRVTKQIQDYRYIFKGNFDELITAEDLYQKHVKSVAFLEEQFAIPFDGITSVITHMAPSFKSIHPKYQISPEFIEMNYGFASHLDDLVDRSKAKYWFHGHVHDAFDYNIGETRVICNPRGYPFEYGGNGFYDELVLE